MADIIQLRRDDAANWTSNNPTLASGEFGYERDTAKAKIGDGVGAWSTLPYFQGSIDLTGYVTVNGTPTVGNVAEWFDADTIEDTGIATSDLAVQSDLTGMVTVSGATTLNNVATWVDADTIKDSGILATDIALNSDLTGMVTVNGTPVTGNVAEWFDADTVEDTGIATADLAVQSDLTGMVTVSGTPTAANVAEWTDANTIEDTGVATADLAVQSDLTGMVTVSGTPTTANLAEWTDANTIEDTGVATSNVPLLNVSNTFSLGQTISKTTGGDAYVNLSGLVQTSRFFIFKTSDINRWGFGANNSNEGGSNAGSHFVCNRYDDAGALIARAFYIGRNNGRVGVNKSTNPGAMLDVDANTTTTRGLIVNNAASATVSIAEFRINGTNQVQIDSSGRLVLLSVPTSDPGGTGIVWSDAGTLKIT